MLDETATSMTILKINHQQVSSVNRSSPPCKMETVDSSDENLSTPSPNNLSKVLQHGANNNNQPQRPGLISFSVAALLADTRPSARNSPPPVAPVSSEEDEDDDVESGQGSVVDVEVLRDSSASTPYESTPPQLALPRFVHHPGGGMVAPVRPTPFSALAAAAAAYSAGLQQQHHHHSPHGAGGGGGGGGGGGSWTLVGHYPGAVFPGASPMGPAAAAAAAAAFAAGLGGSPGELPRPTLQAFLLSSCSLIRFSLMNNIPILKC